MYKSKYFKLQELLPKELLILREDIGWILFDDRILRKADKIREIYGICFVNTNGLSDCGFRLKPLRGKIYSQHLFGRALDIHIKSIEDINLTKNQKIDYYNKVRENLRKMEGFDIIRFEDDIPWLHIDCGNSEAKNFKG